MDDRTWTIIGLAGVVTVLGVVALGVYGFTSGHLLDPPTALLVPSVATLAVVAIVVGALSALGARSRRWRQNPYW